MKMSIAIPCYEMNGRGVEMLSYSLSILRQQTFTDFEVVVSDHSLDNDIYNVCQNEKILNVKYIRNELKRGSSSANINNAILNCEGELIKVLCQDDFLYGRDAIQKTIDSFDYGKRWLVTGYLGTHDRLTAFTYHIPHWNDMIYFENTIGTHSCLTILNDDPIFFDEELIWFMDCEYYYRLQKRYSFPAIIREPTMVQLVWEGQVSNTIINDTIVENEKKHICYKYKIGE